jgi:hypothetical protein
MAKRKIELDTESSIDAAWKSSMRSGKKLKKKNQLLNHKKRGNEKRG